MWICEQFTYRRFFSVVMIGAIEVSCVVINDWSFCRSTLFLLPHFIEYAGEIISRWRIFLIPLPKLGHGRPHLGLSFNKVMLRFYKNINKKHLKNCLITYKYPCIIWIHVCCSQLIFTEVHLLRKLFLEQKPTSPNELDGTSNCKFEGYMYVNRWFCKVIYVETPR